MGGTMPESTFTKLSLKASMYIDRNTYGRVDTENIPDEVKYCTCAIAEQIQKVEKRTGKTSESVGSWSVNYQENDAVQSELYDTLENYLLNVKTSDGNSILCRRC